MMIYLGDPFLPHFSRLESSVNFRPHESFVEIYEQHFFYMNFKYDEKASSAHSTIFNLLRI